VAALVASLTHDRLATEPPLEPLSLDEVASAVRRSRLAGSGSTPDGVHPLFVKHAADALVPWLRLIFNFMLAYCVFPRQWKISNGVALPKASGRAGDPSSFRGLSITSQFLRLFERALLPRMNFKFAAEQAGFRSGYSTYDNIALLNTAAYGAVEARDSLPVAFLDLKAAFDLVPHGHLLFLLQSHFNSFRLLLLFKEYITGRQWRLLYDGLSSVLHDMVTGTPQGGVWSPPGFGIFINPLIVRLRPHVYPSFFADDGGLIPKSRGADAVRQLQLALDECTAWAAEWHMLWSPAKSAVVTFTLQRNARSSHVFRLAGQVLPTPVSYKYLGVTFQSNCRWTEQAAAVTKKARASSFAISRLLAFDRPPGPLAVLTLVRSVLLAVVMYGLAFWRPSQAAFTSLRGLVARPLRRALGLPMATPISEILSEFNLPSLELQRHYKLLNFALRCEALPSHPWHPGHQLARHVRLASVRDPQMIGSFTGRVAAPRLPPATYPSLAAEIVETRRDWTQRGRALVVSGDVADFDVLTLLKQRDAFRVYEDRTDASLRSGLPAYFTTDEKPLACHRARLRRDMTTLNASMFRRKLVQSPKCRYCDRNETPIHVLFYCARYAVQRGRFYASLLAVPLYVRSSKSQRLSLAIGALFGRATGAMAIASGDFILAIQRERKF
jgi:hypothetical protein